MLEDFSLEMTGRDVGELAAARPSIPAGTRISVTFLGSEDAETRRAAARAVAGNGFVPVPHVSARRLTSRAALQDLLAGFRDDGTGTEIVAVGGDPVTPAGPFPDSLSLIESGLLERYGVRRVSIAGYPEGHPGIPAGRLWSSLEAKSAALRERGLRGAIVTQFGFDADPVLGWIAAVRERGIDGPVRIGVPGPTGVRRLLGYATRFGVASSAGIAPETAGLTSTAGPGDFLRALAAGHDPGRHGEVKLHFYTFGGLKSTAEWITDFAKEG
ncbi:methylenetetrahydrofolate reductase [Actinoplanes sp. RD1]|uniref:methylenetetrahydrofolate reductase n=1 Tax=Actinoplanes sp. RD1 TaxID=3064538 RepID=UPI002742083B|nr:methylenetetrahydrofolate reductase [Actinoplanes sp. RD1]